MDIHQHFMRRALVLARWAANEAAPNPMVGALLVKDKEVVGRGWHVGAGFEHAEAMALENAGEDAKGATLYVTLEPCNHQGNTPPCSDAIIKAGISEVVCAMVDPNKEVCGGGIAKLEEAGINVLNGVLEQEAGGLNRAWVFAVKNKRPMVTLKLAVSADGKIAAGPGERTAISCSVSRAHAQRYRGLVDAIVVGATTVEVDNPYLTNRSMYGKNPLRIVLDTNLRTDPFSNTYNLDAPSLVVCKEEPDEETALTFEESGVELFETNAGLDSLIKHLYERRIHHVMVEGGAKVANSFLEAGLVDEVQIYQSPEKLGDGGVAVFEEFDVAKIIEKYGFTSTSSRKMGRDTYYHLVRK